MVEKYRLIYLFITLWILVGCQSTGSVGSAVAGSSVQIDRDVDYALQELYESNPAARKLATSAKGILVFPSIVKAGFMFGGQLGRGGALRVRGRTVGYYQSLAASYGLQAGVQSFGYALFFMNNEALNYLNRSGGWEIGVGPSIVIVDAGKAKTLTTTTARDNIYAFIFGQKGLMAGLGLQGSKITRIYPE
ncbi:YSC84-related protein [Methylomicrobium sp. RS1]|uniref:lipid-binding SYLF domain-containing protein n=1 Tax=Candidatus Methylomicrobium oryzae TaxID=2802053 RepID=UPI0019207845|nr:YSC84-related protein [Methylomicrobium sp. RS1]MBL1265283.1 twin-arginine translocation pathway signal protein [Methylomicrobium sp. RS1]